MAVKKKGLGRGLDGLFTSYKDSAADSKTDKSADASDTVKTGEKKVKNASSAKNSSKLQTENAVKSATKDNSETGSKKSAADSAKTDRAAAKKVSKSADKAAAEAAKDASKETGAQAMETEGAVITVKISRVEPNREQPRKDFREEGLEELAESIRQFGVIQPLLVQKRDDYLEIIAGERRWRAARMAGLKEVPVIIKDYSEQEIVEVSLIENIQREDLNPIEEAKAYQRLLQEFDLKQEDVAKRVSKNRTTITNSLRLLKLDGEVQNMLIAGEITNGHARALLGVDDPALQQEIAKRVVNEKLSVRDIEKLMRSLSAKKPKKEPRKNQAFELACRQMEERMKVSLGTKVSVKARSRNAGRIEIEYYSQDELERIYDLLQTLGGGAQG